MRNYRGIFTIPVALLFGTVLVGGTMWANRYANSDLYGKKMIVVRIQKSSSEIPDYMKNDLTQTAEFKGEDGQSYRVPIDPKDSALDKIYLGLPPGSWVRFSDGPCDQFDPRPIPTLIQ